MFKIIGAILIVGTASVIGLSASSRLSARYRVLSSFVRILNIMNSEICQLLTPIDELLSKLSRIAHEPLSTFFEDCLSEMERKRDVQFGIVWAKTLSRATYLELKPDERRVISELGAVLGRYSAEEQSRAIAHAARVIDAAASVAESECSRLGRLYGRLGIICGIAVVIVFI